MAIRNYVTRGVGPGATIAFFMTGGLSIGAAVVSPTPDYRTLSVSAETRQDAVGADVRRRDVAAHDRTRVITD